MFINSLKGVTNQKYFTLLSYLKYFFLFVSENNRIFSRIRRRYTDWKTSQGKTYRKGTLHNTCIGTFYCLLYVSLFIETKISY